MSSKCVCPYGQLMADVRLIGGGDLTVEAVCLALGHSICRTVCFMPRCDNFSSISLLIMSVSLIFLSLRSTWAEKAGTPWPIDHMCTSWTPRRAPPAKRLRDVFRMEPEGAQLEDIQRAP